jgi:hypothetical protein
MNRADKWITGSAVAVVAAVAGTAGWVSYQHALEVVRLAGETGPAAYAYPVFIDGLVYMSSMVLLSATRRSGNAPALAWWSLATGIALTLAANVYEGTGHGVLGGLAGALPAVALVLSYELLMWLIRRPRPAGQPTASAPAALAPAASARAPNVPSSVNGHGHAALELYGAGLAAGEVPSMRRIQREMHVGQQRATAIRAHLKTVANVD